MLKVPNVRDKTDACELCGRSSVRLTRHHLIPRSRHHNRSNKKQFSRTEIHERIVWLCHACHKQIHTLIDDKTLEKDFNTLEALKTHEGLMKFVAWVRKRPEDLKVRSRKKFDPSRRRR